MADILNKLVSSHLVFRNEDIARKTACLIFVTLITITVPFNLLMGTQHNAQGAPSQFISQTESVVTAEQPCYQYPNASLSELGNASQLAQNILERFGQGLVGQYAPDLSAFVDPRLVARAPPFEEGFDGLIQGYQVLGFTSHNGSTIEIYYSNAPGNNGYFLAFLARLVDFDLVASAPSEYVSVTRGVAEMLGVPLENLTESSTIFERNATSVILSSKIAGQRLVDCDLFAVTFDNMTNRVLAVQSRPFIANEPTPLFTLEQALEIGEEIARSKVLRSDDVFKSGEVVGVRFMPVAEAVDRQPVPGDPANFTYSSRLNIRFGYEYMAHITDSMYDPATYSILVVVDIQSGDVLFSMIGPIPEVSHGFILNYWPLFGVAVAFAAPVVILVGIYLSPEFGMVVLYGFFVPLWMRLRGANVLDSFNRGRIYGHISAKPGCSFTDLKSALGIGNGNLAYHLMVLERLELVKSIREGRTRRFFPQGVAGEIRKDQCLGKTEALVLGELIAKGPVTIRSLSQALGMSRQRVHYNVKLLHKRGLVQHEGVEWNAVSPQAEESGGE